MFRVDILNSSGVIVGDGPLKNITDLHDTRSLDAAGSLSFSIPAGDPRGQYIDAGSLFDVYDEVDGYLGRFLFKSKSIEQRGPDAVLTIEAWDALRELTRHSVAFRRLYQFEDVATVVADLVSVVSGWSATVDAGIGNTTVGYEGESVLAAVDELRDRWGKHYRLGAGTPGANVLEFGAFGDDSGVRLTRMMGGTGPDIDGHTEIAAVENVRLLEESDDIFNRIIPLGAGQGTAQMTIEQATLGDYAVQTGTNEDGSSYYYIEDADSVAAYGVREKVMVLPQIAPLDNNTANIINAANALKLTAEYYLSNHTAPKAVYSVQARALRRNIKPGQTVRLVYAGVCDGYGYLTIDQDFYVMDITRRRNTGGERVASLVISTVADRRTSDTDVVLDMMRDINALKVHIPIIMTYRDIGPYTKRMDASNSATFTARIKSEVLAVNRAILAFRTQPLKSSVTATAAAEASVGTSGSGGGTSVSSAAGGDHHHEIFHYVSANSSVAYNHQYSARRNTGSGSDAYDFLYLDINPARVGYNIYTYDASGDHTHSVTIPNHTHSVTIPEHNHDLSYGLYADSQHPQGISISVDGVDVTAALGGPWMDTNEAIDTEIDITEYINSAPGGLRQNHTIEFTCTGGQGEVEASVDMLVTIQPIAVTS